MTSKIAADPRIDPRIKQTFGALPDPEIQPDAKDRAQLLAEEACEATAATTAAQEQFFNAMNNEQVAPSAGLTTSVASFISQPDGNPIKVQLIRPDNCEPLACIYYIHGGGMQSLSCFNGMYTSWGRIVAAQSVAIAMVDFRNAVRASSATEVAPFPAGLNDCLSGLKWLRDQSGELGIDPARIVVAGDSGGGNLTLAIGLFLTKAGEQSLVKGLYALCPYIAGQWPLPESPSSYRNNGLLLELHNNRGAVAYGIEAFKARDPLAWPGFASAEDVKGFPPTVISVNECDPLRDEGVNFYRLLLNNGVSARCVEIKGTIHATEIFSLCCPDISRETARRMADFASR